MKKHNLYPVQVYEFDFPGDVQHYCEVIGADPTLTQRHESGVFTTYLDAHKNVAYVEIANFVRSCLDEIQEANNFFATRKNKFFLIIGKHDAVNVNLAKIRTSGRVQM